MKKDPHASDGGYMIRSLYFDDLLEQLLMKEKESGVLMRKSTESESMITATVPLS